MRRIERVGRANGGHKHRKVRFMDMRLAISQHGIITVIEVHGDIEMETVSDLRERMLELVRSGSRHFVVDLNGVSFIDSTGLGVLVGALKRVQAEGGTMRLVCRQPHVLRVLRLTGLDKVFVIVASQEGLPGTLEAPPDEP